jgi:hypothetical protein
MDQVGLEKEDMLSLSDELKRTSFFRTNDLVFGNIEYGKCFFSSFFFSRFIVDREMIGLKLGSQQL